MCEQSECRLFLLHQLTIRSFRVDLLENHYKVEAEKKSRRRKRKARSGKKKKVVEISGEQMPEKQVPPLRSLSFSQRH